MPPNQPRPAGPSSKPFVPRVRRDPSPVRRTSAPSDLSREWRNELRNTSNSDTLERTEGLVSDALTAFESGDHDRAVFLAEKAKANAPRSSMIRELLGLSLYHLSRWQEAVRELLTYRRLTKRVDQNHVIADAYRALKKPDRALELCSEVNKTDVAPEVWSELAIVAAGAHADLGEFEKGLSRLAMAEMSPRSVEPYHLRLWYVQADLMEKTGRRDQARKVWEKIAAEDTDFFDVADRLKAGSTKAT